MSDAATGLSTTQIEIPVGGDEPVFGDLFVPPEAGGIVVFAHGSGSSRHSPRNRQVAHTLAQRGIAILLMDLLTEREEQIDQRTRELRFDISLLVQRLLLAADDLARRAATQSLALGYFGASTGAAAALIAAAQERDRVRAVVSRGGRPDLAQDALADVRAPTLLIVGGHDPQVEELNRQAIEQMHCERELVVVPGATHLFEEPGTLDRVTALAGDWFARHLTRAARTHPEQ